MKIRLKLLFIAMVLLSSCTMMKRKYLPGFSVEWSKHSVAQANKASPTRPNKIATHPQSEIKQGDNMNTLQSVATGNSFSKEDKNTGTHEAYREPKFPTDTIKKAVVPITDSLPLNENARKSASHGIGALLTGLGSVLLLYIGPGLGTGTMAYLIMFTIFILAVLACLALSADAVSYGYKAFKEFSKDKNKYSGFGKAMEGFILGIIFLLYCVVIAIIFAAVIKSGVF